MAKKYGVIGYPLNHSLSPQIHNPAFQFHNLNGRYAKIEILPDVFDSTIVQLKSENWSGFNVTIPFKERIIPFLDSIEPLCKQIGAVNTIQVSEQGKWIGYNTDFPGFLNPIRRYAEKISSSLVVGAGGSARAVCFGLITQSKIHELVIVNRTLKRAEQLITDLKTVKDLKFRVLDYNNLKQTGPKFDLIVNTTSIGMGEMAGTAPIDPTLHSHKRTVIYDLIYNPLKTTFLELAENAGLTALNGLQMLIGQAEESFKIWTTKDFPESLALKISGDLTKKLS